MAKLTTHILDTSTGTPANDVKINLYRSLDLHWTIIQSYDSISLK